MRITTLIVTTAVTMLLAGCATGGGPDIAQTPPVVSAPTMPDPTPSEEAPADEAEPASQPGDYLDYYDGAIEETAGTKVLFFHASWCPKCRDLEEDILANEIPDNFTVFKVDFDTATDLRQLYGVTLQTTIVYVDDDGDALAKGVLFDDTTLAALLAAAP
ncbi:MAG: thioredoxin family protein [Microcella sp.]|nr:thioredoxin family protein [Microcella sp.]